MNNTTTATNDSEINALSALTPADLAGYENFLDTLNAACPDCEPVDGDDMSEFGEFNNNQQDDDDDLYTLGFNLEPREDNFRDDVDADANALASAGWGTDEDYGGYGDDSGWE